MGIFLYSDSSSKQASIEGNNEGTTLTLISGYSSSSSDESNSDTDENKDLSGQDSGLSEESETPSDKEEEQSKGVVAQSKQVVEGHSETGNILHEDGGEHGEQSDGEDSCKDEGQRVVTPATAVQEIVKDGDSNDDL
jgi:hypothetical protein